jgi:DNA-binding NarL/FixJ family response regulator
MTSAQAPADSPVEGARKVLSVLLYSSNALTRGSVRLAVGRRPAPDVAPLDWTECATQDAVLAAVARGGFDLLVLDGEASPAGGMGLCKQLKDEVSDCPPVLVLIGRSQDAWLATWSRADFVVPYPLDPLAVAEAVARLARGREAGR